MLRALMRLRRTRRVARLDGMILLFYPPLDTLHCCISHLMSLTGRLPCLSVSGVLWCKKREKEEIHLGRFLHDCHGMNGTIWLLLAS